MTISKDFSSYIAENSFFRFYHLVDRMGNSGKLIQSKIILPVLPKTDL